jgi:hypothetical protein
MLIPTASDQFILQKVPPKSSKKSKNHQILEVEFKDLRDDEETKRGNFGRKRTKSETQIVLVPDIIRAAR